MLYVIVLAWLAVLAGLIVVFNRRRRERDATRAQKMTALLADFKAASQVPANEAGVPPTAAVTEATYVKRQRLLPPAMTLLYYVFRTGLPDHEIFTGLALNEVVDMSAAPGGAQREMLLRRLAQQRLDLVVCNKQLEVVAAVVVQPVPGERADDVKFAQNCLQAAGIRVVRLNPATPPQYSEVHALIYGE